MRTLWGNYARLGYHRLIYTNSFSVLETELIVDAMGCDINITAVLLTADEFTVCKRLGEREFGSRLEAHVSRGAALSKKLDESAPSWVVRISTDGLTVTEVASQIITVTGWTKAS